MAQLPDSSAIPSVPIILSRHEVKRRGEPKDVAVGGVEDAGHALDSLHGEREEGQDATELSVISGPSPPAPLPLVPRTPPPRGRGESVPPCRRAANGVKRCQ